MRTVFILSHPKSDLGFLIGEVSGPSRRARGLAGDQVAAFDAELDAITHAPAVDLAALGLPVRLGGASPLAAADPADWHARRKPSSSNSARVRQARRWQKWGPAELGCVAAFDFQDAFAQVRGEVLEMTELVLVAAEQLIGGDVVFTHRLR